MSPLVHKAVEPDNLSVAGKARFQALVQDLALGVQPAMAGVLPKYDGVYAQYAYNPNTKAWEAFSRTGERLLSGEDPAMMAAFDTVALPHVNYIGELWLPDTQHSVINGMARKQSPQPLNLYLHDAFELAGLHVPFRDRYELLWEKGPVKRAPILPYGGRVHSLEDLYDEARRLKGRNSAYDGLILRDLTAPFIPGPGKEGSTIKIKPRASGDFRVVGVTKGKGKRAGGIGALIVDLGQGIHCEVGTGLKDEDVFGEDPTGRIAEVEYLSLTKDGMLREPSFKVYRNDKKVADVIHTDHGSD